MAVVKTCIPRLVIAATHSSAGKTTTTMGLMAALRQQGCTVQGFKVGPDYLDPAYHAEITGRPSHNLDTWMLGEARVLEIFARACRGADIALIEGVMGLYDGHGRDGRGSTAEVAELLAAPVILLVDCHGLGASAAAMVLGYQRYDPRVRLAGVICNRVSGQKHYRLVKDAIEAATGLPVLGYLPWERELQVPERHLGLVARPEGSPLKPLRDKLAAILAETVDWTGLLATAQSAPAVETEATVVPPLCSPPVKVALARDAAFHFYYQDALELLTSLGAELVPFSPLADRELPAGTRGVILGGGFPEMFLPELAANASMRRSLARAAAQGLPVYAECGGLMYLCREVDGYPMVGVVPARVEMTVRLQGFGYTRARSLADNPICQAGQEVWGHAFHYSRLNPESPEFPWAWEADGGRREGFVAGNVLASYLHLHWGANPEWAGSFLRRCQAAS
ncbi:MAG: cobyrinate a,c-diamide synthase [Clostridia bacterium]|nr:MAG: cobyrinate a,c-diamide synthase [Clostridia bacterium]